MGELDQKGLEAAAKAISGAPFPSARSRSKAEAVIRAYLEAAPSPSPAPGVVEAAKRFPDPGDKMIFLNRNGYDSERERAASVFTAGKEYTVRDVSIGSWTTSLQFDEVEGRWNSVMFGFASLSQLAKSEREGG